MIPSDREVDRVVSETGMDRMQAINHLRSVRILRDERQSRSMRAYRAIEANNLLIGQVCCDILNGMGAIEKDCE